MFDRITQARDFEWFGRHPDRSTFARLASEIEEIGCRELAGYPVERHELTCVMIVRRDGNRRERAAVFAPTVYGRLLSIPADEATCSALFEGAE
jgi:hypothetical protein